MEPPESERQEIQYEFIRALPKSTKPSLIGAIILFAIGVGLLALIFSAQLPRISAGTPRSLQTPRDVNDVFVLTDALFPIIIGFFAHQSFREYKNTQRLNAEGVVVTVPVLDLCELLRQRRHFYYVGYRLPDRKPLMHSIPLDLYRQLEVGDTIYVRYHPQRPGLHRVEAKKTSEA